jgi:hypothetical protein
LRDVARHLSGIPGRKAILWASAGFPTSIAAMQGGQLDLWPETLNTLNDSNVAVYAVDSAGVRTIRGYLAEQPAGRTVPGPMAGFGATGPTNILAEVSRQTGGRLFMNTNDLAKGVSAALRESGRCYRIAYIPQHGVWDGRFLPIRVQVMRKGLEVRHRMGYYAKTPDTISAASRDEKLGQLVASPLNDATVGLVLEFEANEAHERSEARMLLRVEPGALSLQPGAGGFTSEFEVRIAQRTPDGRTVGDFTDEVPVFITEQEMERVQAEGFAYRRKIAIRPGASMVKIAWLDRVSGRSGSVSGALPKHLLESK